MDVRGRYAKLTARTSCAQCGQPVPLTTLAEFASCPYCSAPNEIPREIWTRILTEADRASDYESTMDGTHRHGGREVVYTIASGAPLCEACDRPLPVEELGVGASRNFACTSCGDPASTEPIPAWIAHSIDPARQLYSVDPKDALGGHVALSAKEKAQKPIVMSCPRCGGGLEITASSERLLACRFCEAEVYLPDEIWRRLHPIKQVQPFYVRFEGASLWRRMRDGEERAAARQHEEQLRAASDQASSREREAIARVRRAKAAKGPAWAAAVVLTSWLALCALASWWITLRGAEAKTMEEAGGVVLALLVILATAMVSRPIQIATGRPTEWMIFVTWFWVPFAFFTPIAGQGIALVRAVILARGSFGAASISSGGSRNMYPPIAVSNGESRPAALVFLAIATLWPAAIIPLIDPSFALGLFGAAHK